MVESIYGGKTFPALDDEKLLRSPIPIHQRRPSIDRLSVSPSGLHTISETESGLGNFTSCGSISDLDDASFDGSQGNRKARAISLPAVYRDGSYLRINFPPKRNKQGKKRRFSEPAVPWTLQEPKSLSSAVSHVASTDPAAENPSKVSSKNPPGFSAQNRRHSDPMLYVSEKIGSLDISCSQPSGGSGKDNSEVNKINVICLMPISSTADEMHIGGIKYGSETPQKQPINKARERRRKSSVVPIPFGMAQGKRKKSLSKSRPLSFPPSKNEEDSKRNFRDIKLDLKLDRINSNFTFPNEGEDLELVENLNCEDLSSLEDNESEKYTCEKILTQWMKFFG